MKRREVKHGSYLHKSLIAWTHIGQWHLDSVNTYFYFKKIQMKLKFILSLALTLVNLLGVIFPVVGGC